MAAVGFAVRVSPPFSLLSTLATTSERKCRERERETERELKREEEGEGEGDVCVYLFMCKLGWFV